MFLPVIAAVGNLLVRLRLRLISSTSLPHQANDELQQKISREGQDSVQIDKHLDNQVPSSDSKMVTEDDADGENDADDDEEDDEEQSAENANGVWSTAMFI